MRRPSRFASATRLTVAVCLVAFVTPIAAAGTVLASFLFLPLPASLPAPKPGIEAQISRLYDRNGNKIGISRTSETSVRVERKDIPQVRRAAVISAEDRHFYSHGGVDVRGTLRALWADLRSREFAQG